MFCSLPPSLHSMPSRLTPPPKSSSFPSNDSATYRDLLLFEERLKTNATSLQHRKQRYQLFLFQILLVIAILLSEVLLPPQSSLLVIPYQMLLRSLLPNTYTPEVQVAIHPYISSGMLFVSVTTLVLFFASGMYSEKIAYANKYVPHANRALRSFNMYLNVRKPSLRSKFNPLAFLFSRPDDSAASSFPRSRNRSRSSSTSRPIAPIPPATNPRGELIFSSRVDKGFRESYERYRAVFERKRQEKEWLEWKRTLFGKMKFWDRPQNAGVSTVPAVSSARATPSSLRGRDSASRSGTPPSGILMKQKEQNDSQRSDTPRRPGNRRQD